MADNITGINEVIDLFKKIDNVSVKVITKSAKAGAKIALNSARANAPVDTGKLKRGIKMKLEKRKSGKRVYDVGFYGASGKGEEFVKVSANGKRSFYPVSQEFGWVDKNGVRHQGKKFLRNAVDNNRIAINETMLGTMGTELDKLR